MVRALVMQAAARSKSGTVRAELLRLAGQAVALPSGTQDMVVPLVPVERDEIVLSPAVTTELAAIVREHACSAALRLRHLAPRSRLLFFGPPGNGKTCSAAMLCGQLGIPAYWVSLPGVISSYQGVTGANLAKLLPVLSAGGALVIDELDAIGSARSGEGTGSGREQSVTVNVLLSLLDRTDGGVLIATTNRRDMIDTALLRRFDAQIEFPPPGLSEARELHRRLCARHGVAAGEVGDMSSYAAVARHAQMQARAAVLAEHEYAVEVEVSGRDPAEEQARPC